MKRLMMIAAVAATLGAWADTETVGDYTWTYQINGDTAEIGGRGTTISPEPTGTVTIPSTLGGKPVTSIKNYLFFGYSGLTSAPLVVSPREIGQIDFANEECERGENERRHIQAASYGWRRR